MGYLYVFMVIEPFERAMSKCLTVKQGVIVSSGVLPAVLTLMWKDQNVFAVALSPILGLACALQVRATATLQLPKISQLNKY